MSTLLLAIVVIAGLACPIHMLWQTRRAKHGCISARGPIVARMTSAGVSARLTASSSPSATCRPRAFGGGG